mgnify:CR=1 FL=1
MSTKNKIDCTFTKGNKWFRYRAAAIIVEDGKFLAVTSKNTAYFYTVGGGVHVSESAEECVLREVREETGADYEVDRLAVICENFFTGKGGSIDGLDCHCIEFYFLMKSRGILELSGGGINSENETEELVWIPIEELPNTNLVPEFLRTQLPEILQSNSVQHITNGR